MSFVQTLNLALLAIGFSLVVSAKAAPVPDIGGAQLPINCAELLPDTSPFLHFFESVGRGTVTSDRKLSRRVFRLLALREKLEEQADASREQNPVDVLIRKTLCYYREQKEPLKQIQYDDAEFLKFLRSSLRDLEVKVDDVIFQYAYEKAQRNEYEKRLGKSEGVVKSVRREAGNDADRSFDKLSSAARRKARGQ